MSHHEPNDRSYFYSTADVVTPRSCSSHPTPTHTRRWHIWFKIRRWHIWFKIRRWHIWFKIRMWHFWFETRMWHIWFKICREHIWLQICGWHLDIKQSTWEIDSPKLQPPTDSSFMAYVDVDVADSGDGFDPGMLQLGRLVSKAQVVVYSFKYL